MAAGVPARALLQTHGVVGAANENPAAGDLLEMAFHAKVRVARGEHLRIHRTVRGVANSAAFTQGLMFKSLRAALRGMARETIVVL